MTEHRNLVADIGGTNTRVALASGRALQLETVTRFANAEYGGLSEILLAFRSERGNPNCDGACVALAGPVNEGRGRMTNLDWEITEADLMAATGAQTTRLINDLQAQGHALDHLPSNAVRRLVDGTEDSPNGTKLVVGVGTGFNVAPVFETGHGRIVPPSEAGHINLPMGDPMVEEIAQKFRAQHGFVAVEDLLSGRGLENIYAMVRGEPKPSSTAAQIMAEFESGANPDAQLAAEHFAHLLGIVTGNLSLVHLPFGGVFFAGGVARAFSRHLQKLGFAESFRAKGRFAGFMGRFPVAVIEDDYAALVGCASHMENTAAQV